ncbi:MAG TPA: DUF885 domain-containing protein [Gammaproteobacteria bacterium]|nr:DUF885 domain-containing protein [Gammaproteobacteria bacterium]
MMWRALLLAGIATMTLGSPAAVKAADEDFQRAFGDDFFDRYWELSPGVAISYGFYKYADRLIVPDDAARKTSLAQLDRWLAQLARIDPADLSPGVRADRVMLENQLRGERWALTDLRAWQWDPSIYNVAEPFALLLSLDYAPLDERLRAFSKRLTNVPAYYAAAKASVAGPTREHTQLAIEQNRGALEVFGPELARTLQSSSLTPAERETFMQRLAAARTAIEGYGAWLESLEKQLASGAAPARSFRLGRELYAPKFEYDIQSGGTAEALYERAVAERARLIERMSLLSDLLWPKYFPNDPVPADELVKIGQVIAKLSEQHVPREQLVATVKEQLPELERWVREHDLLELDASKPLMVRETPLHKRGIAGASIDAPGPYDPDAPTYYNVTPLDDLSADRAESWLREYNQWMLPVLNIHEAVPGHYVQLVYANRSPSRIKSIFGNGAMIEGWAVYAERLMLESGYGDDKAESWLIYSKWNLRSVTNTILDYGVHVRGMTEDEAMDLLTRQAFQTEQEAREKWRRVTLTSVQLTSYFSGYSAIVDLREQLKREHAGSFDLKRFHEQFLSYGNAPVAVIRELMWPRASSR